MVKAGKVMKGFSPQIEEEACVQNEIDEENLERLAILLQALYRGWKARQTLRSQVAAAPPPILRQEVKSERLGATDNTRHAALQYLQEHCIHRLFKNLLSRLYYDKPENAREYILQQLKEIHRQQEMQAEETRRKQGENDSYKASTARDEGPEADIDDLGIFTDRDLAVYFNMLAGAGQHAIPAQQLLKEINRFSLPEDATGVGFKSRGTLGPTVSRDVDKKLFCRTMKRQIGAYYYVAPESPPRETTA